MQETKATVTGLPQEETRIRRILEAYRQTASNAIRRVPFWLGVGFILLSGLYLIISGHGAELLGLWYPYTINIILVLVVIPLTAGREKAPWEERVMDAQGRLRLWLQVSFSLLCLVVLNYVVAAVVGYVPANIPGVNFLVAMVGKGGLGSGIPATRLVVALSLEILLPLIFTLLLGARWRELGFCKGHRALTMGLLGGATALICAVVALALGKIGLVQVVALFIQSFLIAGLPEELFSRGIILTRFARLFNVEWAILISAMIFGLGHFATTLTPQDGVVATVAFIILHNGFGGLVIGFIFFRTRSLLGPVLMHGFNDAEGPLHTLLNLPF